MIFTYGNAHSQELLGPECYASVSDPKTEITSCTIKAVLDTGAEMTIVPEKYANHLTYAFKKEQILTFADGSEVATPVRIVDISLQDVDKNIKTYPNIEVSIMKDCEYILIGRDILNKIDKVVLDAPNIQWRIDCIGCTPESCQFVGQNKNED